MERLSEDLWRIEDSCNVYLVVDGDHALAIDYGTGAWLPELPRIGINHLDAVYLTHHHADQCGGLAGGVPFPVHAPRGEEAILEPASAAGLTAPGAHLGIGCPASYDVLPTGVPGVIYDMAPASDILWRGRRLRFVHTPGHGRYALSIVIDHHGRQLVFCGDAVHDGAVIRQPYHLEWDHWTGEGALAAWHGVRRLRWAYADLLCPSHGPVIDRDIPEQLDLLSERLLRLVEVKGGTAPWTPDDVLRLEQTASGARRISDHLYQFGGNGYLLLSDRGEAFVVDPFSADRPALDALLGETGPIRITLTTASHYHLDHSDDLDYLRETYGATVLLHPSVAYPLERQAALRAPWLPYRPIHTDRLAPESGVTSWNEYEITWAPAPGQTWWHTMFSVGVDGQKVLFTGDTFQPPTRWHGTGGFCAYNRSRFSDGVAVTCDRIMAMAPDVIAAGHGTIWRYSEERFRKTRAWAAEAEAAVRDLCPGGDIDGQYHVFPRL